MEPKSALVIDDERCVRELLVHVLETNGFSVICVDSIAMAEYAIKIHKFDAAFIDVVLTDGNGDDFLTKLMDEQPATRCALLTGHPDLYIDLKRNTGRFPAEVVILLKPLWGEQILEVLQQMFNPSGHTADTSLSGTLKDI